VGFEITDDFARFDQMNDMFTRAMWDDKVSAKDNAFFASYRMEAAPRRGEGFGQRDFACATRRLISDIIQTAALTLAYARFPRRDRERHAG
jgi:hypothetical protein